MRGSWELVIVGIECLFFESLSWFQDQCSLLWVDLELKNMRSVPGELIPR